MRFRIAVMAGLLLVACGGSGRKAASFGTEDGFTLAGDLLGAGTRGVVLVHGADTDSRSWLPLARQLSERGFRVLVFDFRGHGRSQGERSATKAPRDVAAAARFLRDQGVQEVVVVGETMGGLAALKAVSDGTVVAGVATLSAPQEFSGLRVGTELASVFAPKAYLVTEGDAASVAAAAAFVQASPEPRTTLTYPGSLRGIAMLESGRVVNDLIKFIDEVSK